MAQWLLSLRHDSIHGLLPACPLVIHMKSRVIALVVRLVASAPRCAKMETVRQIGYQFIHNYPQFNLNITQSLSRYDHKKQAPTTSHHYKEHL